MSFRPDPDLFAKIEAAAHDGAFGQNHRPTPTDAQCQAGNYKVGRVAFHGFRLVIEQPRGTYRTGVDAKTGKPWATRLAAHYGYFYGTKGADGDGVDCFIGSFPNSELAYVINQFVGGRFDEHKVMLGFPDEASARRAYTDSFERGWPGLESICPLSLTQLRWWLKFGDMKSRIDPKNLPFEGLEMLNPNTAWSDQALPIGKTLDQVLYHVRCNDEDKLLFDAVTVAEILEDSEGVISLDALVTPFSRLERKMETLRAIMDRTGHAVKVTAMQITDPFKQLGRAMVATIFELSDGQTVSIYFHNPDANPAKLAPSDELISWKWLLNKKDITIVVAPERGQDLNPREVARRIMGLAEKNSPAFARVNAKRAERMQAIQGLKDEIASLETALATAQRELEVALQEKSDREEGALAARREMDDELTYVRQGTYSADYLRGQRSASLLAYFERNPEMLAAHEAALSEAAPSAAVPEVDPAASARRAEAIAQVVAIAESMGATTIGPWEQSAAVEWQYSNMVIGGVTVRIGASTGGVVQVEGDPFDPLRNLNDNEASMRSSIAAAVAKLTPPAPEPEPQPEPTPEPAPEPEPEPEPEQPDPTVDEQAADRALFQSVIDGTSLDMLAPELADKLEAAYMRNEADPEMMVLFEAAVNAYQAAMMAATANL